MTCPKMSPLGLSRNTYSHLISSGRLLLCHTTRCSTSSGSTTPLLINSRHSQRFSLHPLPWLITCQVRYKCCPPPFPACSSLCFKDPRNVHCKHKPAQQAQPECEGFKGRIVYYFSFSLILSLPSLSGTKAAS